MAVFVNCDIFIAILDPAMSHLMSLNFLVNRRTLSEKCIKAI